MTSQLVLRPTGGIEVVGLRFQPFGAARFFRVRSISWRAPRSTWPPSSRTARARACAACRRPPRLSRAPRSLAQQALLPFMSRRQTGSAHASGRESDHAAAWRRVHRSHLHRHGLTRRHLERQFRQQVGMGPKRLARISRFQHALQLLDGTRLDAARHDHGRRLRLCRPGALHQGLQGSRGVSADRASAATGRTHADSSSTGRSAVEVRELRTSNFELRSLVFTPTCHCSRERRD